MKIECPDCKSDDLWKIMIDLPKTKNEPFIKLFFKCDKCGKITKITCNIMRID